MFNQFYERNLNFSLEFWEDSFAWSGKNSPKSILCDESLNSISVHQSPVPFWCMSMISHCIPLQVVLNSINNCYTFHLTKLLIMTLMSPRIFQSQNVKFVFTFFVIINVLIWTYTEFLLCPHSFSLSKYSLVQDSFANAFAVSHGSISETKSKCERIDVYSACKNN